MAKAIFGMVLAIKNLLEVRFSWFEVCNSCYWGNSDIFSLRQRSDLGCHSDWHKMTIWPVRVKTVIAISRLLGGLFWWFKVASSCVLVYSDIFYGSYVSIMSHCDVTLIFRKIAHTRIRTGFDESFPHIGLVFVIWRAEYSLLSTLEQFLCQTERSFWLVGCFVDTVSLSFFEFFDFLVILRSFLCHSDKSWP